MIKMNNNALVLFPYFTFHDMTRKGLLMVKLFVGQSSVQFSVNEKEILITFSDTWCSSLTLKLPVKVVKPESVIKVANYDKKLKCYIISLKRADFLENGCYSKIPNLDVITKYLTWGDGDFQEEPDVTNLKELSEVTKKLETLSCNDGANENQCTSNTSSDEDSSREIGTYGFARKYKNKLSAFEGNWQTAIELPDPDNSNVADRYVPRWENERESFELDHYLADFFLEYSDNDDEEAPILTVIIMHKLYWQKIKRADEHKLKPSQMELMAQLPLKKFNLTNVERSEVLHSLFDIILAYAYDYRINRGRHNSESAWNINKLSATLSWLQVHKNAGEAVTSFFRRSLTFPLYRYWSLSLRVLDDTIKIFRLGRRQILNCLVSIYELFEEDDDRRILNELYISDYLIWVQQVHPETLKKYVQLIESCKLIKKQDVFSMLPEIEQVAIETLKSEDEECNEDTQHRYNIWKKNLNHLTELLCKAADVSDDSVDTSLSSSFSPSSEDYTTTETSDDEDLYSSS
ncbi:protein SHQ1 homolog [Planococcus citri]|uniref:protein SHQ1 homolog n=1 Tax=Planococcus citri TaxID=170843 RepID=UPI0031F73313